MGGACNAHGEMINANKVLVGKPERKRQLGRSRRRMEETGLLVVNWICLAHGKDRWRDLVNTVMKLIMQKTGQTDMGRPIRCFSLTLECKEHFNNTRLFRLI
jgi:hypothetical protein